MKNFLHAEPPHPKSRGSLLTSSAVCLTSLLLGLTAFAQTATPLAPLTPITTVPEVKASQDVGTPQPQVQAQKPELVDFKTTIGGGSPATTSSNISTTTSTSASTSTVSSVQQPAVNPTVSTSTIITSPRPKIPNSIAVTDFSVKNEYQEFFYDEKASSKGSFNGNSNFGPTGAGGQTSADAGAQQSPVSYTGNSTVNANSEFNYSKNFGSKRTISYEEIRGINADIKASIIKAGYKVIQAAPNVAKDKQGDEFFDLRERINRGDFGDAQYVLHGTIVNLDIRSTNDQIPGTNDYAYRLEYSLLADFTLVNTETLEVAAAFNAMGSGQDMYLGKYNAKYVPKINKITKELLVSFGHEAEKKLYDQLPPLNKKESALGSIFSSKQQEPAGVGDPSTLKVYKPGKNNDLVKEVNTDIPLTVYRK